MQWAHELIDMIHPAITTEDWTMMDCQEYLVDLEMSLTGVATSLEVSGPGQLRDDQMGTYQELEPQVIVARKLATELRAKHLETYDLQAVSPTLNGQSGVSSRLRASRLRLDMALTAEREGVESGSGAGSQWQNPRVAEDPRNPSAPLPSPTAQNDSPEESWPWFSGQLDDLMWFR